MSASSVSRLALFVSVVGLTLALATLLTGSRKDRRDAREGPPDSRRWTEESHQALAAEIEALRGEFAAFSQSAERRALGPGAVVRSTNPIEATRPGVRAADAPEEFQLRRMLIEGFHELEPGDRRDAIDRLAELARWGDEEAMALIVESLGDESASVRACALKELVRLDEANLPAYLRQSITDPSHKVREVVASRLDELPDEEAGPLLVGLLRDPDPEVVIEAIRSLDDLEYSGARPALVEQLQSRSLDVATRAAQELIELGDLAAAGGTIERVLVDYAKDDVSGRINNVKRLRRLRAVSQLERILASDASLAVREEARDALASLDE
jgi:HEAT repeat protein